MEKEKNASIRHGDNPKAYTKPASTGRYFNDKIFLTTSRVELSEELLKRCIVLVADEIRSCPAFKRSTLR